MDQYEYAFLTTNGSSIWWVTDSTHTMTVDNERENPARVLLGELNNAGNAGWEVVGTDRLESSELILTRFLLKRRTGSITR